MPSLIPQNDNAGGTESPVLRAKLPTRKRVTKRKAETDVIEDSDIHATKRRSSSRDAEGNGQNHEELGSHEANGPAKTTATNGQKVAKKHKKFIDGEDEEPLVSTALANGNLIEKPKPQQPEVNSDSDDDEAPEAITAAAGLESSRLLTAQAARISKKQASEQRQKRRDHDARLKTQSQKAQQTTKKPRRHLRSSTSSESAPSESNSQPTLLPDSILSAAPPTLAPQSASLKALAPATKGRHKSLATDSSTKPTHKKLSLLAIEPKPPKDLKRDSKTKIRVLRAPHVFLPPKSAGSNTRLLREAWLMGRRGGRPPKSGSGSRSGGSGRKVPRTRGVERRKWNSGGFVVKRKK